MKKRIYIVPHTHWDREWYFTNTTSNILLQRLANDLIDYDVDKFVLDGQSSLIHDMLINSPELSEKLINKIKEEKLIVGPLYVQQDNFNVTAATTQMNIEFGRSIIGKQNTQKTMYMPDSFGFNEQLPQLFKMNGFDNFVFWRGIKPEDKQISNLFNWTGIDGTKLNASCMSNGYYTMGQHYPYNGEEEKTLEFEEQLLKQSNDLVKKSDQKAYFLPLGGDQAPYEHGIKKIINNINSKQNNFEFVLGGYDDYFKEIDNKPTEEIKYTLNYSGTSKIHRTIHSNRTDIKILFRECERLLHLGVFPLEVMFNSMGGKILSRKTIENEVISPLLKSSAHDSLGSCNSDITNSLIKTRLTKIKIFLESYIDLIIRDMNKIFGKENKIIVYNHLPFKRTIFDEILISTDNEQEITSIDGTVIELDKQNISWKEHDTIWQHRVQVSTDPIEAYSWKIIDISTETKNYKETDFVQTTNEGFKLLDTLVGILAETDDGDEFDFSEHANPVFSKIVNNKIIYSKASEKQNIIKTLTTIEFENKQQEIEIMWTQTNDQIYTKIKINNVLENIRMSLVLPKNDVTLSRHMAFIKQEIDEIKDWKERQFKDKPVNSYANDGLAQIGKLNIFTRGNNEVSISDINNKIVLYRSVNFLGKPELRDRPGVASGLPQKVHTPDALLKNEQVFNFAFSNTEDTISKLNNWNAYNILSFIGHKDPIIQKYDRFVINEVQKLSKPEIQKINFDSEKELLGFVKLENGKLQKMTSNPTNKTNGEYKPYEIKIS